MLIILFSCAALIATTTLIHYEALRTLHSKLPSINIPNRTKLLVAVFAVTAAHFIEIAVYGVAYFILIRYFDVGNLVGSDGFSFRNCIYFSSETYTSLGFGDLLPVGPIRLVAGIETLNGLLMIGWSASYLYIAMERFWSTERPRRDDA